jgi:ATP-dependent DNA helicase PIF1
MFEHVLSLIQSGKNIFLTGPGGCGKSWTIEQLTKIYENISITSTTGVSSYLIGGQTIHSFSGIGVFNPKQDLLKKIKKNRAVKRITECKLLVIDEISMLGATYLLALDKAFKLVRKNQKPFGGIQVIFTGDFFQLPPIQDGYAFECDVWNELDLQTVLLEKVYRFTDEVYSTMLARIRKGEHLPEDNVELFKRVKAFQELDLDEFEIKPTFLSCKRIDVDEKNKEELDKNPNELVIYLSRDEGEITFLDLIAPKKIELKVGSQVMLTVNKNVEEGLVNGSRGVITSLESDIIYVKFMSGNTICFERHEFMFEEDGKVTGRRFQFPFILSYCLTIHKIQGSTIDCAVMDIGNSIFENSMSYVALSRVKSLSGLYLKAFSPYKIRVDPKVVEFYKNLN